ncbi:Protein of unknown function [Lachnospiraceae bacterium NK3A20]|nr:Protein of unknown function [Lachnospiraceae bacterium NK3A20]
MVIFCVEGVAWDIRSHGNFSLENYGFTRMFLGCVVVGLGFGIPSIVYRRESLPMPIRVLIHMGIGCIVYTITAFAVGWIGGAVAIGQGILAAAMQFAAAFVIWLLFMRYYRAEARRMNERIQKMKGK